MPSIADAVAQISAAGLPVLLIDTCSLVDVIREPLRPDELRGCVEAALELLRQLQSRTAEFGPDASSRGDAGSGPLSPTA